MGYPALANNNPANMSQDDSVAVQLPSRGRGNSRVAYLNRSIDQLIYDFMEEEKIPGMTLAIVQAPYIPRVVGYGLSDAETGLLASTNTLWPAAEISQAYAAIAAFQLVEQGSMEITDKVSRFVKDLPEAWKNVTVLQLLQHTSGIPDYRKSPQYDAARDYDPAELLSLVRLGDLEFPSGTDVRQSATNFLLLSMVVDAVAGMPYEEFVRQRQFQPLGLNHTMFGKDLGAVEQDNVREHANRHTLFKSREAYVNPAETASGYAVKDGKITPVPAAARSSLRGFADIWSTPEEISFWDVCLAGSILVKDEKHRDMIYKPVRLDNGKIVQAMARLAVPAPQGADGHQGRNSGIFLLHLPIHGPGGAGVRDTDRQQGRSGHEPIWRAALPAPWTPSSVPAIWMTTPCIFTKAHSEWMRRWTALKRYCPPGPFPFLPGLTTEKMHGKRGWKCRPPGWSSSAPPR